VGDRIVYTIKQDKNLSVNLYSHWGGYDRFARPLLMHYMQQCHGGMTHHMQPVLSYPNLIGDKWDEELGFGLWASNSHGDYGGDHPDITIDLINKTVEDETGIHSFESFITYHKGFSPSLAEV
jgi:hypothetical protein